MTFNLNAQLYQLSKCGQYLYFLLLHVIVYALQEILKIIFPLKVKYLSRTLPTY